MSASWATGDFRQWEDEWFPEPYDWEADAGSGLVLDDDESHLLAAMGYAFLIELVAFFAALLVLVVVFR